jgi:hypothetical protein
MNDEPLFPQIPDLIAEPDIVEMVRDQVAAILSLELQNQYRLAQEKQAPRALDYNVKVYVENARPYESNNPADLLSFVNVTLPKVDIPRSNSRLGDQKETGLFHLYCAACGNDSGNFRDDKSSALRAWKVMRLVRRILMADAYTYLGLRKTISQRHIFLMEAGTPPAPEKTALAYTVIRASLEVSFVERSTEVQGVPLEGIDFKVTPETGEVIAKASLTDRVTGIAPINSGGE